MFIHLLAIQIPIIIFFGIQNLLTTGKRYSLDFSMGFLIDRKEGAHARTVTGEVRAFDRGCSSILFHPLTTPLLPAIKKLCKINAKWKIFRGKERVKQSSSKWMASDSVRQASDRSSRILWVRYGRTEQSTKKKAEAELKPYAPYGHKVLASSRPFFFVLLFCSVGPWRPHKILEHFYRMSDIKLYADKARKNTENLVKNSQKILEKKRKTHQKWSLICLLLVSYIQYYPTLTGNHKK